jgi:hypothetical protein
MDQDSLVTEQIDVAAEFLAEFEKTYSVASAFWLRKSGESSWYLYVSSPDYTSEDLDTAYGQVLRLAQQINNPYFDPFKVKLILVSNPLSVSAVEILKRFPGRMATRLRQRDFGGVGADEVYVYPIPVMAST